MKRVYSNISLATGALNAGLYKVQVVPREWLAANPVINFNTGTVPLAVPLLPNRQWLELEFAPESYDYDDRPKSNRGGPYREVAFAGLLNSLNAPTLQVLNTLADHQLVMLLHDRQKRLRIVGTREAGMAMTFGQKIQNTASGTESLPLSFLMESELPPPFYGV